MTVLTDPLAIKSKEIPYYKSIGNEIEVAEMAHSCQLPILLKGPTGSGKSRFVEHLASRLGLTLLTVSCHEETSAVDLIGRHLVIGQETKWIDGPLSKAVRDGSMIYLDEIAEARPDTLVLLHSLTDHRRTLFIDRLGEQLVAPPSFMLIASFNPGYQHSFKELKASTRQRFLMLSFDYPEAKLESEIISKESELPSSGADKLVRLARKIRNLQELGLSETVSTRLLIDAAKLMKRGMAPRLACDVAIVAVLTDDKETTTALRDLTALHF